MSRWMCILVVFAASCSGESMLEVGGEQRPLWRDESRPLLGASGDSADRACHVVLKEAAPAFNVDGLPEIDCSSGSCWLVWRGLIDISNQALEEGASPHVLYRSSADDTQWKAVAATPALGAAPGFARYQFELRQGTVPAGLSGTGMSRAWVELVPYVRDAAGVRVFDHNRHADPLENYRLELGSQFSVAMDPSVCGRAPGTGELHFQPSFSHRQRGALSANRAVRLHYPLERIQSCRGTHNGFPAWDIRAHVRFQPSGEQVDGTVRGFDVPGGVPSNGSAVAVPFDFLIPPGTTGLELWFVNRDGAGGTCEAYDSDFGRNYQFRVLPKAAQIGWAGDWGGSLSRDCQHQLGMPDPIRLDSYILQRACSFVDAEVWVPGISDQDLPAEWIWAEVTTRLDGGPETHTALQFQGRHGNNYRFRWEIPRASLVYGSKWNKLEYSFRFSTDGQTWHRLANADGSSRSVIRDTSFCNPSWASCDP